MKKSGCAAATGAAPEGVEVTVGADRGCGNGPMMKCLSEEPGFESVLRIRGHIRVTSAQGERRRASDRVGAKGRARTLRGATVTDAHALTVGKAVCVRASAMAEPWGAAASDERMATATLIRCYARRWGIETSFRDLDDWRFGMDMGVIRIRDTTRRDRLLRRSALSIALRTLLGAAGERLGCDRWLKADTVKTRTPSLFRQGLMLHHYLPDRPERRLRPLVEKFAHMLLDQPVYREISSMSSDSQIEGKPEG